MAHKVGVRPTGYKNGGVPKDAPAQRERRRHAAVVVACSPQNPIVRPRLKAKLWAMRSLSKSSKSFASETLFQSSDVM